jgi:hypothetical protein
MCIFLILILPDEQAVSAAKTLGEPLGVRFGYANISSLDRQVPADSRPVYATRGQCDCGTRLGCRSHDDPEDHDDPEERFEQHLQRRRTKVQKQGWSATKIDRWEAQQRQSHAHHTKSRALQRDDTLSLDEWRALLVGLLAAPGISHVELVIHMFSGLREDETITLQGRQTLRCGQLDDETLMHLKWDTLHVISR